MVELSRISLSINVICALDSLFHFVQVRGVLHAGRQNVLKCSGCDNQSLDVISLFGGKLATKGKHTPSVWKQHSDSSPAFLGKDEAVVARKRVVVESRLQAGDEHVNRFSAGRRGN